MGRQLLFFILVLLALAKASAQTGVTSTSAPAAITSKAKAKIQTAIDMSTSGNLNATTTSEAKRSTSLEVTLSRESFAAVLTAKANHTGQQDLILENTVLVYSAEPIVLKSLDKILLSARAILPTQEEDREKKSFRGAVSGRVGFEYRSNYLVYFDARKSSHEFERSNLDEPNLSYRGRLAALADFPLANHFTFSLYGHYEAGRTYTDALRTNFRLEQELSHNLRKGRGSVYIMHSNLGDALSANGVDSNIEVFDEYTSTVAAGYKNSF